MTILPENVKLIDFLKCPTCSLTYFIDHPVAEFDDWGQWRKVDRVKRFKTLVKGTPARQDCDKKFAYNVRDNYPSHVRDTSGNWYKVTGATLQGVLGMVPCTDIVSASWITYPTPQNVETKIALWKFASKNNKLKELEESLGKDKFGDISGKVLAKCLGVKKTR